MEATALKNAVVSSIDADRPELEKLSRRIHATPELAFQEVKAAEWLTAYLAGKGFSVEKGICNLPTAFRAGYGQGQPVIALMAEYDALPEAGHACGHNLIAASAIGAGAAARMAVDKFGGRVLVMGTPGEELYGGKVIMVERGAFDGVDVAMLVHPAGENTALVHTLACETLDVEFFGKAAHAAERPEAGINALEAMVLSFNAINSLRQHIRDKARIHGIITEGGEAANIVPAHSAGSFIVRAEDDSYLDELKIRVLDCFAGAAAATGAKLEYSWGARYAAMLNNVSLARLFKKNAESLGRRLRLGNAVTNSFSTDVGNVSQKVPAIQPLLAVAPAEVLIHSPQFAEAAVSRDGFDGMADAAKALAMTVVDLLASPDTFKQVKHEFSRTKAGKGV